MTSTCCPGRSVGGHRLLLCPGSGRGGRPSSVREKGEVGSGPSDDLGGFRAAMLGDVDLSPQKLCGARAPHRDVPGGWWRLAGGRGAPSSASALGRAQRGRTGHRVVAGRAAPVLRPSDSGPGNYRCVRLLSPLYQF